MPEQQDHDQRFKVLLEEFFAELFRLFFPEWAERFDFSRIEWLRQEVFPDPPQGERRVLDLVAKLYFRDPQRAQAGEPEATLVIIHVEVESGDSVASFRERMWSYYKYLRDKTGLPVLPVAIYLRVGLNGLGWDRYEEYIGGRRVVLFEYLYAGLPALDAEQYVQGDNPLGFALAALMRTRPEQALSVGTQALQRIASSAENNWRKFLLAECVLAYVGLDPAQRQALHNFVQNEAQRGATPMVSEFYNEIIAKGERRIVRALLERRFGPLNPRVQQRLEDWPKDRLEELGLATLEAHSLQELGLEDAGQPNGAGRQPN